ncbi:MAG: hypothetical protein JWN24_2771 [Phycisphaerales bacterium]|nr:hypothetical protein [Phycisphaerales bacterium]
MLVGDARHLLLRAAHDLLNNAEILWEFHQKVRVKVRNRSRQHFAFRVEQASDERRPDNFSKGLGDFNFRRGTLQVIAKQTGVFTKRWWILIVA